MKRTRVIAIKGRAIDDVMRGILESDVYREVEVLYSSNGIFITSGPFVDSVPFIQDDSFGENQFKIVTEIIDVPCNECGRM